MCDKIFGKKEDNFHFHQGALRLLDSRLCRCAGDRAGTSSCRKFSFALFCIFSRVLLFRVALLLVLSSGACSAGATVVVVAVVVAARPRHHREWLADKRRAAQPEFRYVEYDLARGQQRLVGLDADRQLHLPRRGHRGHEEHSQR